MLPFGAIVTVMFFFTNATREVTARRPVSRLSGVLTGTAAAALVVAGATRPSIAFGVTQRVFLGAVVLWMVALGCRLYLLDRTRNADNLPRALDAW